MAKIIEHIRFQNREDSLFNWNIENPILASGEFGIIHGGGSDAYGDVILIGDGQTTVTDMLNDREKFNTHMIYTGRGAQGIIRLPITNTEEIGGILMGEEQQTGLKIMSDGTLINAVIDGYDNQNRQYIIDKLYIRNLTTDNTSTNIKFNGNEIVLRSDLIVPLDDSEYSGLRFKSAITDFYGNIIDGFLGIDGFGNPVTMGRGGNINYIPSFTSLIGAGFIAVNELTGECSIGSPKKVIFRYGTRDDGEGNIISNEIEYDGIVQDINIDITPPDLYINSQKATLDLGARTYSIDINGGLTPENKALVDRIPIIESTVQENVALRRTFKGDNIITCTDDDSAKTVTITHKQFTTVNETETISTIRIGGTFECVDRIETDEYGHVTKIIKRRYLISQ